MSLERVVHSIGNFTRKAAVSSLLGLSILGTGSVPVYAQQNVKYAANPVKYVPCTSQKTTNEGLSPGELLSLLGVMAESSKKPETQDLGVALLTLGVMRHQKEVAIKGRTQVNINQGGGGQEGARYVPAPGCVWANPEVPNDLTVKRSIGVAFVANSWRDLNYNGRAELNEYIGIKDRFNDKEPIILAIHDQAGQGIDEDLKLEVYDPNGKRVFKKYVVTGMWKRLKPGSSKHYRLDWNKKNGGPGSYMIVWSSERITEMKKFEIVPASERPEN